MTTTASNIRPRASLLSLFDPLAQTTSNDDTPTSPLHQDRNIDSPTPSEANSDKENSAPAFLDVPGAKADSPLTLFTRRYADHKPLPHQVPLPMDRLIDFDTSIGTEDGEQHDGGAPGNKSDANAENEGASGAEDGGDENAENGPRFEDGLGIDPSNSPLDTKKPTTRSPLADISASVIAHAPPPLSPGAVTPSPTKKAGDYFSPFAAVSSSPEITHAPESSRLSAVIDSINNADGSPSSSPSASPTPSPLASPAEKHTPEKNDTNPQITISSPNSPDVSAATNEIPSPTTPRAPARRRESQTSTSSFDPRRVSVDLQSSFSTYFACPESSFDLLNDKISFFNHDSFLNQLESFTDESATDFAKEEEEMEELVAKLEGLPSFKSMRTERKEGQDTAGWRLTKSSVAELEDRCAEAEMSMVTERLRDVRLGLGISESEMKAKAEGTDMGRPQRMRKDRSKLMDGLNMDAFGSLAEKDEDEEGVVNGSDAG